MIPLTLWLFLWSTFFVFALPPSWNINRSRSLENFTITNIHLAKNSSKLLQRKVKMNRTKTIDNDHHFDINSYRSSWTFVDKNTVRVRFRLYDELLHSIMVIRFLVRHTRTNYIRMYDEQYEIINSTLTLYLQNIKHGRHTVCLLLYTSKLMKNPTHIFCQDIIFNFHKYGRQDTDSDEYGNTFFFLLTQYGIVTGILIILQIVQGARKRRFLGTVYEKANSLRNFMSEYHRRLQENKSTSDSNNNQTHTLEYLIYNLNRNVLYDFDPVQMQSTIEPDESVIDTSSQCDRRKKSKGNYLQIPNMLHEHWKKPLSRHPHSISTAKTDDLEYDDDIFDENVLEIESYEEQSTSFRSISHILDANKPWIAKLTDNGDVKHSILS